MYDKLTNDDNDNFYRSDKNGSSVHIIARSIAIKWAAYCDVKMPDKPSGDVDDQFQSLARDFYGLARTHLFPAFDRVRPSDEKAFSEMVKLVISFEHPTPRVSRRNPLINASLLFPHA